MKHTTITHAICISLLVLSFASLTPGLHAQSPATNTVIATNLSVTNLATPQASTNTVLPLTVQECVAMALDKNRDYLMAKQDVKIKEAAADALYANFFPSLAFKSTLTVLDPAMVDDSKTTLPPTLGGGTMQTVYSPLFTMGLSATYAIPWIPFFSDGAWGMINKGHELLLKDLEQARNKLGKIQQDVTASVSKAFWQLKLAELVYDLTSSNNGRLVAYLDVARRNFNEGRVSKYELLRAQVQLANNQPELLRAENNVRLARVALLQQLSLDLGTRVEIRGRMETAFVTVNEQQALASAMTNRSELKDTDLALEVARLQQDLAEYGTRPQLAAFANYNWELKKTGGLFSQNDRTLESSWNAGLQLSIPISELLNPESKSWNNSAQHEHSIKKAQLLRSNVESLIQLEVKQNFLRLEENRKTIASQKVAVELSTEGLRTARIAYNEGQIGNVQLMDAELDYQKAQLMEYQSWFGYISAKIDLYKAMGILTATLQ